MRNDDTLAAVSTRQILARSGTRRTRPSLYPLERTVTRRFDLDARAGARDGLSISLGQTPTPVAPRPDPHRLRLGLIGADAVAVAVGLIVSVAVFGAPAGSLSSWELAATMVAVDVAWMVAIAGGRLYVTRCVERPSEELRRLLGAGAATVAACLAGSFFVQAVTPSRGWVIGMFTAVTAALLGERRVARRVFSRLRATGRIHRRIAIVGADAHAVALMQTMQRNPGLGYEVVGFIGDQELGRRGGRMVLGSLDNAVKVLQEHGCVGAIVSMGSLSSTDVNRVTRSMTDANLHVALSTSLLDIDVTRIRPQGIDGHLMLYVEPAIRTGWRFYAKRVFDVALAGLALLVVAPVIGVAAVLIKLDSDGPVFFRQQRVGRDGVPFPMVKLRTMYVDAEARKAELMAFNEAGGPMFKMKQDPRITRVGRVLRRLSIDELPQFWNVVRGEMSVVGPRPALPDEVTAWDGELHNRLRVLPGITGMWQVSGRSETTFEQYKRLDLYYVDNWSLLHDIRIVAKTFWAVVAARGAS